MVWALVGGVVGAEDGRVGVEKLGVVLACMLWRGIWQRRERLWRRRRPGRLSVYGELVRSCLMHGSMHGLVHSEPVRSCLMHGLVHCVHGYGLLAYTQQAAHRRF